MDFPCSVICRVVLSLISSLPLFASNVFNYGLPAPLPFCRSFPVNRCDWYCQLCSTLSFFCPLRHQYLPWDPVSSWSAPANLKRSVLVSAFCPILYSRLRFYLFFLYVCGSPTPAWPWLKVLAHNCHLLVMPLNLELLSHSFPPADLLTAQLLFFALITSMFLATCHGVLRAIPCYCMDPFWPSGCFSKYCTCVVLIIWSFWCLKSTDFTLLGFFSFFYSSELSHPNTLSSSSNSQQASSYIYKGHFCSISSSFKSCHWCFLRICWPIFFISFANNKISLSWQTLF